jgi:hypothetical protein
MKYFKIIILLLITVSGYSQSSDTLTRSNVIIHKDARLDVLAQKEAELNLAYTKAMEKTMMGYRIQVMSTNDRDLVMKTRALLYKKFPEQRNYLIYQAPYAKLRFGNFKTKDEADTYMKQITKLLNGASIYLVPDRIEITPENN